MEDSEVYALVEALRAEMNYKFDAFRQEVFPPEAPPADVSEEETTEEQ